MKKILVTGACGYLGGRICKYLSENGFRVTAFTSFNPSKYIHWTSLMEEVIIGDICNATTIASLAEKEFDVAIHLISLDHNKSEGDPSLVSSINVTPTWDLLEKLTRHGLEKFIYFSTIHVYGKLPNKVISENYNPAPLNAYGLTHLLSENICNYYNAKTETDCINVRLSNSYGSPVFNENNCWWLVVNDLCKSAFLKNKIALASDGSPQRDFIHIADICNTIQLLIEGESDCLEGNVLHMASGETLSILDIAHIIKDSYNNRFEKEATILFPDNSISSTPKSLKSINKYFFDISKIKSLGSKTSTDMKVGINEIFDYLSYVHSAN